MPVSVGGAAIAQFNFLSDLGGALGSAAAGGLASALPVTTSIGLIAVLPAAAIGVSYRLRARQRPTNSMEDQVWEPS